MLLVVCNWTVSTKVIAQSARPENKLLQTAIDAMLGFIYYGDKPYIIPLETLYDKDGLICKQRFTSDPTLKNIDFFKLSFNDGGFIFITYKNHRYDFFGKNRITGMDYKISAGMISTIRIDCDEDGKVNAIQMHETYDRNRKIDQRIEFTFDDKRRIVKTKDFKVNLLDNSCPSNLRSERSIRYLENDGATITNTYYTGNQCDGTSKVHSITTMTITKIDEYTYKKVWSDGTEKRCRYDDKGRLVYESYRSGSNGWETLTEYEDERKVKEDNRTIKNGELSQRTVTHFLPEGNLKQYYDKDGDVCKEEQNFKSRKKVDGKWTEWAY
jgi:hypothetical protein